MGSGGYYLLSENRKRGGVGGGDSQEASQSVRPGDRPGAGFTLSGRGNATSPWGIGRGQLAL